LSNGSLYEELSAQEYHAVFREWFRPLRNYLYYRCGDAAMAEDLAQDAFVKLWENRARIEKRTVKAYLYTIGHNLMVNQIKRNQLKFRLRSSPPPDRDFDTPEKLAETQEYHHFLEQVISSLPEGGREVFLMSRLEDLTYQEIADRLGLSVKAIEKRMTRVLKILREKLGTEI
jgi:RNA polymerase sigma-70 factor (ECF subfamily)